MRVVLDTNVVISAFLFGGYPNDVLLLGAKRLISLYSSETLLRELFNTISRKKFEGRLVESEYTVGSLLLEYQKIVRIIEPVEFLEPPPILDKKDEKVLATAYAAQAQYIVSGDHHLLDMKTFSGIGIISSADFIKRFSTSDS